ncbi:MAG: hypothetical protein OEM67_03705 [Thermoleophilia bacterium]|nr:hypothetical protein [Thermoleophilia bacterium]MDH3724572.1 hypothetical protein [Thermoleophilia bacterium]
MSVGLFLMTCALAVAVLIAIRLGMTGFQLGRKNDELTGANTRLRRENAELQGRVDDLEAREAEFSLARITQRRAA